MGPNPIIIAPEILLPKAGTDMHKYAVIACDQFTSQPEYWQNLEQLVGDAPSTLRMIFPEAYLPLVDHQDFINAINAHIDDYLSSGILRNIGPGFILVERNTADTKRRLGLMLALDLDQYSYEEGSKTAIRASEATIVTRIPPRLKIREHAAIEIPHVLVLFDDPNHQVIEHLYEIRKQFPIVYDFDLNQNGGHLRGYQIKDTQLVEQLFDKLLNGRELKFIVGDGNHSLATAKAHWEKIKPSLSNEQRQNHPARYSLVEAMNIYDDGLVFEPIHRVVFNADASFIQGLKQLLHGPSHSFIYQKQTGKVMIEIPLSGPLTYKIVQDYIDAYMKNHSGSEVDYIHGIEDLLAVTNRSDVAIAIAMPSLTKADIIAYLDQGIVLPRKSFSMGHAYEKRYYLESKLIK